MINTENLINFISLKKDKIIHFENIYQKFYQIYSRETIEFIDLIAGVN